jgi:hypothetical protein
MSVSLIDRLCRAFGSAFALGSFGSGFNWYELKGWQKASDVIERNHAANALHLFER